MADCSGECGSCSSSSSCEKKGLNNLRTVKHKIMVLSGKGGVGKSSLAASLAYGFASAGKKTGLLDIDFHGPSIPTIFGAQGEKAFAMEDQIMPVEKHGVKLMSIPFLLSENSEAVVWRGPMKAGVIKKLLEEVLWDELDYLVMDFPPGTGDEALSACQLIDKPDGAIIVTTPQEVSLSDCRRCIDFCRKLELPILGVVENMSGFVCPDCGTETEIFSSGGGRKMAEQEELSFLGRIPIDPGFMAMCENGGIFTEDKKENSVFARITEIIEKICGSVET